MFFAKVRPPFSVFCNPCSVICMHLDFKFTANSQKFEFSRRAVITTRWNRRGNPQIRAFLHKLEFLLYAVIARFDEVKSWQSTNSRFFTKAWIFALILSKFVNFCTKILEILQIPTQLPHKIQKNSQKNPQQNLKIRKKSTPKKAWIFALKFRCVLWILAFLS